MPNITIIIGEPILTGSQQFTVVITNSLNEIVYGPVHQTNAPFTVSSIAAGDYTMSLTGFNIDGLCTSDSCFTVTEECDCPAISNAAYALNANGIPYFTAIVALPDGLPECGLQVSWQGTDGTPGSSVTDIGSITYGNISQLQYLVDDHYTMTIYFGTNTGYAVQIGVNCCNGSVTQCGNYTFTLNNSSSGGSDPGAPICIESNGPLCNIGCDYETGIVQSNSNCSFVASLIRISDTELQVHLKVLNQNPGPYKDIQMTWLEDYGCDQGVITVSVPNNTIPFEFTVPQILTPCVPWTNQYGGLYHNAYDILFYGCNGELLTQQHLTAPAP